MKTITLWLIPEVFGQIWRDERRYIVCEAIRSLRIGTPLLIEEGDDNGARSGRVIHARIEALTPSGEEGLPADVCVFEIAVTAKRG